MSVRSKPLIMNRNWNNERGDIFANDSFSPFGLTKFVEGEHFKKTEFQIEFEPDPDDEICEIFEENDVDPDGYNWQTLFEVYLENETPELAQAVMGNDSESATCVLLIKAEEDTFKIAEALTRFLASKTLINKYFKRTQKEDRFI